MIKRPKKFNTEIYCPVCSKQYEACDIYIPEQLIGKQYLIRDDKGKAIKIEKVMEQELIETYICDECSNPFQIEAKVEFNVIPLDSKSLLTKELPVKKVRLGL